MSLPRLLHITRLCGGIILLAGAYVVAGRLAMLLAIPPGYISAIFPPVGIALAAVLIWGYPMLPGVFLGSTLLNLSLSGTDPALLTAQHWWVSVGIACGTTLQSFCASWLLRRLIGMPNPLTSDRSILRLLLIGGPLTCLISASIGVIVLYGHQLIPVSHVLFSWWSWWIGDSIGVLVATPLMFILFGQPRDVWRNRIGTVGLPMLLSCLVMVIVFVRSSSDEQNRLQLRFDDEAKLMVQSIKSRIDLHANLMVPVERLLAASAEVSRSDFAIFVEPLVKDYAGVRAVSWNARVTAAQRQEFEHTVLAGVGQHAEITERDAQQQLVPAAARDEYFPITYIEPMASNRNVLGFDVSSGARRRAAMQQALVSGEAALTAPLKLVQDTTEKIGMLLFYPVYSTPLPPQTLASRQQMLQGYVVAVLHIADVIAQALTDYRTEDFGLNVSDITDAEPQVLLSTSTESVSPFAKDMVFRSEFGMAGRRFLVEVRPSEHFLQANTSLQSWAILAGGLLLCSLLGGFLLSVTGRAEHVRQLVRQRTLELSGILDNAAEAILIFDATGSIDRANTAAQQLFGYSAAQFNQMPIGTLLPALQQLEPVALQSWLGRSVEAKGASADAGVLELEVSLSNYVLPDKSWYICLLHDISERKKVERLKREFVATVSHELRTPLTSIKGALELVNAEVLGPIPLPVANMLQLAAQNTARLTVLVNDILDIEKLELGNADLPLQPMSLRSQLELAVRQNQGYADNFSVQLSLDSQMLAEDLRVFANEQRLQQVLSNLISNAVKFSDAGGLVQIVAGRHGDDAFVKVCDHGHGIPTEFRSRIFQKFAQADSSDTRRQGGTGLGLSICKELMSRMRGTIGFDSVEGVGSTFYITLPLTASSSANG